MLWLHKLHVFQRPLKGVNLKTCCISLQTNKQTILLLATKEKKCFVPNLLLNVLHTFVPLGPVFTWIACCLLENNLSVGYLKISDWRSTSPHEEEHRPSWRGAPTPHEEEHRPLPVVFSEEHSALDQRAEDLRCPNYHLPLMAVTFTFQASHKNHANVKQAQTLFW